MEATLLPAVTSQAEKMGRLTTRLTGRPLNWAITLTAGAGFMLFGYDQGVVSGLLTGKAWTDTFPAIDTTSKGANGRPQLQGTVVAIYDVGCFFGAIIAFTIGERLGRKRSILLGTAIIAVGTILQASSFSLPQIFIGRIQRPLDREVMGVGGRN